MKIWILNMVGISLFGILIEILLPKGQTNKYIKGILSLVLIYVVVSPLVSVFTNYSFGDVKKFIGGEIEIDYAFISDVQIESNKREEKLLIEALEKEGIKNVSIDIISNIIQQKKIEYVKVNIDKVVIENENANINIKERIEKIITSRLKIKADRIYYE